MADSDIIRIHHDHQIIRRAVKKPTERFHKRGIRDNSVSWRTKAGQNLWRYSGSLGDFPQSDPTAFRMLFRHQQFTNFESNHERTANQLDYCLPVCYIFLRGFVHTISRTATQR
ncbi:hypothetical protein SAMN05421753_12444 [Planctomicrobium piriforme]|uniref:Uncharacterized protein n=1 Tax=Planctomicrobium piriforme TaxID=1576369 RepID=A0A1I3SLA4_9PLAN|nr:hypothetical protein SAMN05421753_12444 [Planctomicrobium piriforme]